MVRRADIPRMTRFILSILLLIPLLTQARELSLSEALRLAKEHSRLIQEADAVINASRATVQATAAERWPTLSLTGNASYLSDQSRLTLLVPPLAIDRVVGSKENYQTDARISVPVWTGGKIGSSIALARSGLDQADIRRQIEEDRVALQTKIDYYTALSAERAIDIARATVKRTETISLDVASLYEAGVADSTSLLEAATAQLNARSRLEQAESVRRSYLIQLAYTTGLPADEPLTLEAKQSNWQPTLAQRDSLTDSSAYRPEIRLAEAVEQLQHLRERQQNATFFPTLVLTGGYSYGKPNLDRFNDRWNDYWTVGMTLTWSLNLGGQVDARRDAIRFDQLASRLASQRIREHADEETRLTREAYKRARRLLDRAIERSDLVRQTFRQAELQHREGLLTTTRLLQIETTVTEAEAEVALNDIELLIALARFHYATGSSELHQGWE